MARPLPALTIVFWMVTLLPQAQAKATKSPVYQGPCGQAVFVAEQAQRLPRLLLHAVSLTESGRQTGTNRAHSAWPWTINAAGKGKFFRTKAEAIREIKRLQSKGVKSIDVGCMQINLVHHGKAFASLEEALDPVNNVAYAAVLLRSLRNKAGSWAHAVGRYHTSNWEGRGRNYWRKVRKHWVDERRRQWRETRLSQRERYAQRIAKGRPR